MLESRFDALAESIRAEHPSHLPCLREILDDAVGRLNKATDKAAAADRVVAAADAILGDVDADAVASYFGRKEPRDGAAAKKRGDDMDEQRAALRHALLYRAMALSSDDAVDELDRRASGERHASMIAEGEKTLEKTEEETRRASKSQT